MFKQVKPNPDAFGRINRRKQRAAEFGPSPKLVSRSYIRATKVCYLQ